MKFKLFIATLLGLILLLTTVLPGCSCGVEAADSYTAIIPAVLHGNSIASMSVSLFSNGKPVKDEIEITLLKGNEEIQSIKKTVSGSETLDMDIPDIAEGDYRINVKGSGFDETADITVENSYLVFLETDKPIYKPGQTMHIRALTLDADLKPVQGQITIEVLDAKGIKVFRQEAETENFGLVSIDLPISGEPNQGTWKLTAITEKGETQIDVAVEEYVLPKYEVSTTLPKEWFMVNEEITGTVSAEYSFGKPVKGQLEIKALRYVGEWEEYTTFTASIDGEKAFVIDAPGYVAGVPAAGGQGNVMLEITVTEPSTGYSETTSSLLTVTDSPLNIQLIPESTSFKPGLPFKILVVAETPDNSPVDTELEITLSFVDNEYGEVSRDTKTVTTKNGKALVTVTPPDEGIGMVVQAYDTDSSYNADAEIQLVASYSPSGNFIHVEQTSDGTPGLGEDITFKVYSTKEAVNFYYEVVSRGRVVFSDYTNKDEITIKTTPVMAPSSRLLVYQILPNSEVAADYIPFNVTANYPNEVTAEFDKEEAAPGDTVTIDIQSDGTSIVGIAAVDKSVFILAENRLNLQQVFNELEALYMAPRVELHESIYYGMDTRGALDVFKEAGVIVLSNNDVPEGKEIESQVNQGGGWAMDDGDMVVEEAQGMEPPKANADSADGESPSSGLAEVERVRQFFPETWLWELLTTDSNGKARLEATVPDTITTWMMRAVAISEESGLGVAEASLKAFQPFFISVDLPYSAIRGEEFPVSVAIYNYMDSPQEVVVEIEENDWFELLDGSKQTVTVDADEVGGAEFMIRIKSIGTNEVKITARSTEAADAVIKSLIVEPEGVAVERVENLVLSSGATLTTSTSLPYMVVEDSGRAYLAMTASFLTQTMDGLDSLIQMPFGCGEQNMMLFTPDVFITKYLEESGQLKPEIMAKAEKLMITGYQRELTYRHNDGSFSAFGESDESGSLWLTAFVLKSFAQAEGLIYIDDAILEEAADWITSHQNADGSFDQVGTVIHQELLGGLKGKEALTAFTAIALLEAGETTTANRAVNYLEEQLDTIDDAYTMAMTAYALELAGSQSADAAYNTLMDMAIEDENGIHWGNEDGIQPLKAREMDYYMPQERAADIETTGYAMMALNLHGDALNASRAAKWLTSQRNAYGGYGSTQDTVVALQALTEFMTDSKADVDLQVKITAGSQVNTVTIDQDNYDVLQIVEIPVDQEVTVEVTGSGEAIAQTVLRYNIPEPDEIIADDILTVDVSYDVTSVSVNDLVKVSASVAFNPVQDMVAGMVVLDVSVPTGFSPVTDSIADIVENDDNIKRYEVAGRKVIFYIEDMMPGDVVSFEFYVQALYPVKAKAVTSQVYSYYQPDIRGETLGEDMTVTN